MAEQRIAIVTGAARGIGAAIAQRLSADGFAVAALDLTAESVAGTADSITAAGGRAIAVGADVSDSGQVDAAFEQIVAELGPPTVLVNNAGIARHAPIAETLESDWNAVMDVNLRGAFLMSKAAAVYMVQAQWGRVVNLSSTSALGLRGQVGYSTTKAGLQGFTKTLAFDLGPSNITVNAIAPGFIETDMSRAVAETLGLTFDELVKMVTAQIAVRRSGQPEDVAAAASFFVRDEASFVSGQVLYLAGGPRS